MKIYVVCLFFAGMLSASIAWECGRDFTGNRAINLGMTKMKQFPWLGLCNGWGFDKDWNSILVANSRAVLLSPRYALTTGTVASTYSGPYSVTFGDHCRSSTLQCRLAFSSPFLSRTDCNCPATAVDVKVAKIFLHPDFNKDNIYTTSNIALLEFDEDIEFSEYIQPICLPDYVNVKVKDEFLFSTYGDYDRPLNLSRRQTMSLKIKNFDECITKYAEKKVTSMDQSKVLCADNEDHSPCFGDFGAPLIALNDQLRWTALGILQMGLTRCKEPNFKLPSLFVDLRKFTDWIRGIIE